MNFDITIEDAVCHILSNYSGVDHSEKELYLIKLLTKKNTIRTFGLDELKLVGKHDDDFSVLEYEYKEFAEYENKSLDEWYDKARKDPAFIFSLDNKLFALDGQHRINEIIKNNVQLSEHLFADLSDCEDWIKYLCRETNPYRLAK